MTRNLIALVVGTVALVAAGCSSASVAATVNGSAIEGASVLDLRVSTDDQVSVSGEQFRNDLTAVIFTEALLGAAEEDFDLTDLDSPESRVTYLASAGPREQEYLSSIADDPTLTDSAVALATTQLIVRDEVVASLASDEAILENIWQNSGGAFMEVCARHILVATEEEAFDVIARLEAARAHAGDVAARLEEVRYAGARDHGGAELGCGARKRCRVTSIVDLGVVVLDRTDQGVASQAREARERARSRAVPMSGQGALAA